MPIGTIQSRCGQPNNEGITFVRQIMRGARMLHAVQTKLEYPDGTAANRPVAKVAQDRCFAIDADTQRQTDLIMEALVREYMTVRTVEIQTEP